MVQAAITDGGLCRPEAPLSKRLYRRRHVDVAAEGIRVRADEVSRLNDLLGRRLIQPTDDHIERN